MSCCRVFLFLPKEESAMKITARVITVLAGLALLLAGLAACSPSSQSSSSGTTTLTVATVNNSQMVQMDPLAHQVLEKHYPNIKITFVTFPQHHLPPKL